MKDLITIVFVVVILGAAIYLLWHENKERKDRGN